MIHKTKYEEFVSVRFELVIPVFLHRLLINFSDCNLYPYNQTPAARRKNAVEINIKS